MPSRAKQGIVIIRNRNPRNPSSFILISVKTGYQDVWIGNQHFYHNYATSGNMKETNVDFQKLQDSKNRSNAKTTIVIRRRSGR